MRPSASSCEAAHSVEAVSIRPAAPGRATGIPQIAPPTDARRRTRAARETRARRVRPPRAAIEPRRHAGASERVLEQTEVAVRRADEDRHLVEADAAARFARARAARSRRTRGPRPAPRRTRASRRVARRRLLLRVEQETAQTGQVAACVIATGIVDASRPSRRAPAAASRSPRGTVANTAVGTGDGGGNELGLGRMIDRHVEQQDGAADRRARCSSRAAVRNRSARSAVAAAAKHSSKRSSSCARSGPASGSRCSAPLDRPASRSSCSVRASARGKPGVVATGSKYRSDVSRGGVERRTRRHRLGAEPRARRHALARQRHNAVRAASCVRLRRCTPNVAGLDAATTAREVVRRAARGADDRDRVMSREALKKGGSRVQTNRRRRGLDDAEVTGNRPLLTCPGAVPGIRNGSTTLPCEGTIAQARGVRASGFGVGVLELGPELELGYGTNGLPLLRQPPFEALRAVAVRARPRLGAVLVAARAAGVGVLHGLELEELFPVGPLFLQRCRRRNRSRPISRGRPPPPAPAPCCGSTRRPATEPAPSEPSSIARRSASRQPGLTWAVTR